MPDRMISLDAAKAAVQREIDRHAGDDDALVIATNALRCAKNALDSLPAADGRLSSHEAAILEANMLIEAWEHRYDCQPLPSIKANIESLKKYRRKLESELSAPAGQELFDKYVHGTAPAAEGEAKERPAMLPSETLDEYLDRILPWM